MLPVSAGPGAFQQLRQQREHRRRVAAGGRRFADGQADLALRHGDPGQAVHQQQHVLALVPEPLGDPGGDEAGAQPDQRRLVGRGDDHHRPGQPGGAQVVLQELAYLPAALADQGHHGDLRLGPARDHRQQAGLAHPGAGEDAHPLAPAAAAPSCPGRARRAAAESAPGAGAAPAAARRPPAPGVRRPMSGRRPAAGPARPGSGRAASVQPGRSADRRCWRPGCRCRSRPPGRAAGS